MGRASIYADHEVCMQKTVVRVRAETLSSAKLASHLFDSVVSSVTDNTRQACRLSGIRGGEPHKEPLTT